MSEKSFDIIFLELWSALHEAIVHILDSPNCIIFKDGFPSIDRYTAYNNMLWLLDSVTVKIADLRDEEAKKAGIDPSFKTNWTVVSGDTERFRAGSRIGPKHIVNDWSNFKLYGVQDDRNDCAEGVLPNGEIDFPLGATLGTLFYVKYADGKVECFEKTECGWVGE